MLKSGPTLVQVDLYFSVGNVIQSVVFQSPRNELEALHLILSLLDKSILSSKNLLVDVLQDLRNMILDKIQELGSKIREDSVIVGNYSCERETSLLRWGESEGVKTKLEVACKSCYLIDCRLLSC